MEEHRELKFRQDGTFTIIQFTDLHWTNGETEDLETYALMNRIVKVEAPDLIMFTGDIIHSKSSANPEQAFVQAVKIADDNGVPWAAVYGNHDAEAGVTREQLMELQLQSRYCLSKSGPDHIKGVGNFTLEIHGSSSNRTAAVLYGFDSGSKDDRCDWEYIAPSQISWYLKESGAYTANHNGFPVSSLAFMHIPLPEYQEIWNYETCYGHNYEGVGCSEINSGLFAAFLQMNDVKGVFVGHNHVNDYWGEYHGIRLCYGRSTGFGGYGNEGFLRGARIIRLREHQDGFQTWLRLEDGSKLELQREHSPEQIRNKTHE